MRKIKLSGIKTQLSKEEMKKISGGYMCCMCYQWAPPTGGWDHIEHGAYYYKVSGASGCPDGCPPTSGTC